MDARILLGTCIALVGAVAALASCERSATSSVVRDDRPVEPDADVVTCAYEENFADAQCNGGDGGDGGDGGCPVYGDVASEHALCNFGVRVVSASTTRCGHTKAIGVFGGTDGAKYFVYDEATSTLVATASHAGVLTQCWTNQPGFALNPACLLGNAWGFNSSVCDAGRD